MQRAAAIVSLAQLVQALQSQLVCHRGCGSLPLVRSPWLASVVHLPLPHMLLLLLMLLHRCLSKLRCGGVWWMALNARKRLSW